METLMADDKPEQKFTMTEAMHLVSREVAKQREGDLVRMISHEKQLEDLKDEIKTNTELTTSLNDSVKEMLDIMVAGKGTIRFLSVLGRFFKWAAGLAVAYMTLRAALAGKFPGL